MAQQNEAAVYGTTAKSDPEGEFSLVRGGPFYRLQEIIRLIDADRWNLGRRILFAIAIGWLPLVLITAVFDPPDLSSLIRDYAVNVRMLFAVPVLLAGQLVMEKTFRALTRHIREAGLLAREDLVRMDEVIIARLIRLRDSILPELLILLAVYVHIALIFHARVAIGRPWEIVGSGTNLHASVAGWYYALVSAVIYEFLLMLSVWKWSLWSYFLFRLSRLNLQLVATHPDHHGGVGFLGLSPIAGAPIALTASAAIGSVWRLQILHHGAHLMDYKLQAIVLLVVILLIFMGPLVFFVPRLGRLRQMGILQYGTLAQLHSTYFHQKWILHRVGREEEFLAAPEVSTLTDLAGSYDNIEHMQPFPLDRGAFVALALAVATPLLPVVLAEIPLSQVLKALLSAVK